MNNDKRKLAILGVLIAGILGIGAWQFSSALRQPERKSKSSSSSAAAAKPQQKTQPQPIAELDRIGLMKRNPFQPSALPDMTPTTSTTTTTPPSNPPRSNGSSRIAPQIDTKLPPFQLPGDPTAGTGTPGVSVDPSTVLRSPDEFAYSLIGVLEGPRPMAVFKDDSGKQHLARVGENISAKSKLVGIQNGKVTVQHNGKTITLTVGGK
jgi:hypothetical protein